VREKEEGKAVSSTAQAKKRERIASSEGRGKKAPPIGGKEKKREFLTDTYVGKIRNLYAEKAGLSPYRREKEKKRRGGERLLQLPNKFDGKEENRGEKRRQSLK